MTAKPYASRLKLCALAREDGHIVSRENGKTVIDNGAISLSFNADTDITDKANKTYTCAEAFDALGIELR